MERNFLLPSREWTRGSQKCSKKTRPYSSCCWGGTRFVSSRDCPYVSNPWLGWLESFCRIGNCHGIKAAVRRLQSRPPAVREKREGPPEKQCPRLVRRLESHLHLNTTGSERNFEPLGI
jgi:hypothetical protein